MFIEVKKISSSKKKKADDGTGIMNPMTKRSVEETGKFEIQTETIRIDEIKSFRGWGKDSEQEMYIDGEVTKIYFKGDKTRERNPEMLINEPYNSFADRLNTVRADVQVES